MQRDPQTLRQQLSAAKSVNGMLSRPYVLNLLDSAADLTTHADKAWSTLAELCDLVGRKKTALWLLAQSSRTPHVIDMAELTLKDAGLFPEADTLSTPLRALIDDMVHTVRAASKEGAGQWVQLSPDKDGTRIIPIRAGRPNRSSYAPATQVHAEDWFAQLPDSFSLKPHPTFADRVYVRPAAQVANEYYRAWDELNTLLHESEAHGHPSDHPATSSHNERSDDSAPPNVNVSYEELDNHLKALTKHLNLKDEQGRPNEFTADENIIVDKLRRLRRLHTEYELAQRIPREPAR